MTTSPADQWDALVKAELRRCGSIIVALSRCRQLHPALWQTINGSHRGEHRQMELEFSEQETQQQERQR